MLRFHMKDRAWRAVLVGLLLPAGLAAQGFTVTPLTQSRPIDPTYRLPLQPDRTVRFTTSEGTWMSLDVSPDGATIVFDLLGDLYTLPIAGGRATRIMSGRALDMQPRFSPDGKHIVFVSDREGTDNIWIADADGRRPRALVDIPDTATAYGTYISQQPFAQPVWTPDGTAIVAGGKRYALNGGAGVVIPDLGRSQVAFGGDGRYAYFPGGSAAAPGAELVFSYDKIFVYDFMTGRAETVVGERPLRALMRPAVSRDNRWLAYVVREDMRTAIRLRDLRTSEERWLTRDVQHDASGATGFSTAAKYPGYAFTPDSKALIVTAEGKFWRIDVASGARTPIPFVAEVEQDLAPLSRFQYPISDSLTVRQIREPRLSPDGRRLAFVALDKVYVMDFPGGTPRRVTRAEGSVELAPAWSPDGRELAFATFADTLGGDIYRVRPELGVKPERLTRTRGLYVQLAYAPDGRLVFGQGSWREHQAASKSLNGYAIDWYWMSTARQDDPHLIASQGGVSTSPQFLNASPGRVVLPRGDALVSMEWDGSDQRVVLRGTDQTVLSPTGHYAIKLAERQLYLHAMPTGQNDSLRVDVLAADPQLPVRRLSRLGADFAGWSADGKLVYFALGHSVFIYDLAAAPAISAPSTDVSGAAIRHDIVIRVPRDRPRGTIALRGARLITMKGDEIIENGDLVIRDDRIVAIGRHGDVAIPGGARVVNVAGKTILPGYIDVHAHPSVSMAIHKSQWPQFLATLAFGVTTIRDPQTQTMDYLSYSDRIETGEMLAPRLYATGYGLSPWREKFPTAAATRDIVQRFAQFYQTQTIKEYVAGNRKVRQWMIMAAREFQVTPTTEGGADWRMTLTEMLDGYSGHEHNYEIYPVYRDFALLQAASGIILTPVVMLGYGVEGNGGNVSYWITREPPFDDPKVRRYTPGRILDAWSQMEWRATSEYNFRDVSADLAKLVAAGATIAFGEHGTFEGIGHHWELWMMGSAGLSPHEVLRAATISGARTLGLDGDLGSLEPGKLADLQILTNNPLDNLRQTTSLKYVMKNGRLYDAETLDEVWPKPRALSRQWWWTDDLLASGAN